MAVVRQKHILWPSGQRMRVLEVGILQVITRFTLQFSSVQFSSVQFLLDMLCERATLITRVVCSFYGMKLENHHGARTVCVWPARPMHTSRYKTA